MNQKVFKRKLKDVIKQVMIEEGLLRTKMVEEGKIDGHGWGMYPPGVGGVTKEEYDKANEEINKRINDLYEANKDKLSKEDFLYEAEYDDVFSKYSALGADDTEHREILWDVVQNLPFKDDLVNEEAKSVTKVKPKKGKMRKLLGVKEGETIREAFDDDPVKATKKLIKKVGKDKASEMINFAANISDSKDPDVQFFDRMQDTLDIIDEVEESVDVYSDASQYINTDNNVPIYDNFKYDVVDILNARPQNFTTSLIGDTIDDGILVNYDPTYGGDVLANLLSDIFSQYDIYPVEGQFPRIDDYTGLDCYDFDHPQGTISVIPHTAGAADMYVECKQQ